MGETFGPRGVADDTEREIDVRRGLGDKGGQVWKESLGHWDRGEAWE